MKECIKEKCKFYLFDEAAYEGCMYGASKDDYSVIAPCMNTLEDEVVVRIPKNKTNNIPIWQLPVIQSDITDQDWIHPKAKYHCFVNYHSLCGKYLQDTDFFETSIESGEIAMRPELGCKVCRGKWLKEYNVIV